MKFLKILSRTDNDITSSNTKNETVQFPYSVEDNNNNNVFEQLQFVYSPVLRIQKAWRKYRENRPLSTGDKITPEPDFQNFHSFKTYNYKSPTPYNSVQKQHKHHLDNRLYYSQDLKNNNVDYCCNEMSTDLPYRFNNNNLSNNNSSHSNSLSTRFQIESDPNSFSSDYSEINDSLKEHLADVKITTKEDLEFNNLAFNDNNNLVTLQQQISCLQRSCDEDDIDFQKRVRKTNLLSLAQEFAVLKRMNSCALPFDLHHDKYKDSNSMSDTASETDDGATSDATMMTASNISIDSNVVTINHSNKLNPINKFHQDDGDDDEIRERNTLNNVPDVVKIEPKLTHNSLQPSSSQSLSSPSASSSLMGTIITITNNNLPSASTSCHHKQHHDCDEDAQKRWSRLSNREEIRKKLAFRLDEDNESFEQPSGLFYVNEIANDLENVKDKGDVVTSIKPDIIPSIVSTNHAACPIISTTKESDEDFFSKQARLQTEAKMALAQVRPMAHMQLQLEKQKVTKSPLADIVGMPGYCDGKQMRLNFHLMNNMNIAQLQVVVNDLHARIEELNIELMQQLVCRDDLHMAQDSMLVDIEDLTGRAQEFAARVNKKMESSKYI